MEKVKAFWKRNRGLHLWLLISGGAVLLFQFFKQNRRVMDFLAGHITAPFQYFLGRLCSLLPFSCAELGIALLIFAVLFFLGQTLFRLIRKKGRLMLLYRRLMGLLCAGLTVYAGFCLLWGVYYYTSGLEEKTGVVAKPSSIDSLYDTTMVFVKKLNRLERSVARDKNRLFNEDIDAVFQQTDTLYQGVSEIYPFLAEKSLRPKKIFFSNLMSYLDFTGFFCPFTGEANINIDSPSCFIPSTIAHEMAHQKNVAMEQEANFTAVLACDYSGITAYQYSGYLLAFVHLSNSLYQYDKGLWSAAYSALNDGAKTDLAFNNEYWSAHRNTVTSASNQVYESFLYSYDQELGLQSYGAVVDWLIAYYCP